jgi:hypothetical protein
MNQTLPLLVSHGVISIPPTLDTRDLSEAEDRYRAQLWPPTAKGMLRWRRVIWWADGRAKLCYRFFDVPARAEGNGDA